MNQSLHPAKAVDAYLKRGLHRVEKREERKEAQDRRGEKGATSHPKFE